MNWHTAGTPATRAEGGTQGTPLYIFIGLGYWWYPARPAFKPTGCSLSPSSDLHITPQIYISYEICGAHKCSIPSRTVRGAVILPPPSYRNSSEIFKGWSYRWSYLNSDLLKVCCAYIYMNWHTAGTPATRAEGGTQGTPLYIYRVGVLVISS